MREQEQKLSAREVFLALNLLVVPFLISTNVFSCGGTEEQTLQEWSAVIESGGECCCEESSVGSEGYCMIGSGIDSGISDGASSVWKCWSQCVQKLAKDPCENPPDLPENLNLCLIGEYAAGDQPGDFDIKYVYCHTQQAGGVYGLVAGNCSSCPMDSGEIDDVVDDCEDAGEGEDEATKCQERAACIGKGVHDALSGNSDAVCRHNAACVTKVFSKMGLDGSFKASRTHAWYETTCGGKKCYIDASWPLYMCESDESCEE